MHVLIFTGQFGMGHIAAAQAVQEEILRQEPTASVTVLDIVEDCFPQLHRLVYGCFDFTVNYCSGVYNAQSNGGPLPLYPNEANDGSKIGPTAV